MRINIKIRTVSRNGQVAIPKRFLEALGVTRPGKVQVIQERQRIVIRPSPMARMSDEAFLEFLSQVRRRNTHVNQEQVAESIRQVRRGT